MSNMKQKDIRPAPAEIEFKGFKFLITDRPTDLTIPNYILVSIVPHNGWTITEQIDIDNAHDIFIIFNIAPCILCLHLLWWHSRFVSTF